RSRPHRAHEEKRVAHQRRPRPGGRGGRARRGAAREAHRRRHARCLRALPPRARPPPVLPRQRDPHPAPLGHDDRVARAHGGRGSRGDAAHARRRGAAQFRQSASEAREGRPMKIKDVKAYPTSFPIPPANRVALGIGTAVKRDAVLVKIVTDDGVVGWGEAHHGRAHTAVAKLIESTLRQLILGLDAHDVVGIWEKMYRYQLASHGMGAGACLAISGIDMALWDIRGKALGLPLYKLLGGARRAIPAYAGGVSLGYQEPSLLIEEAKKSVDQGYKAIKLRLGDSPKRDIERVRAIRQAFGDEFVILTDANIGCSVEDVRQIMPALDELNIGWLEEPFPAHDFRSYREAR